MKILVPTDFSENAMKAALYAAEVAQRTNSRIFLLHACELGHEAIRQPFGLHEKYDRLVMENRKAELSALKRSMLAVYAKINIRTEMTYGDAVDSILEFSESEKIDLIIMGTKGAGKVKERLAGTVAAKVAGKAKVPVLIVPEKYRIEKPDGIVFTTNHFERNKQELGIIVKMAKLFSSAIHAVVFLDTDKANVGNYLEKGRQMNHYLSFLKKTYPGIDFTGELIEGKNFENAIGLYHTKNETDIAAMITYPKGFWEKLMHKSVTKKMIYHSNLPVLAIPALEKVAGEQV